jgi:hypothetical protein|tara:strand:- start:164 stop:883 length:720 start_codon:yes stop_codon:yes gene_type:complete
MKKTIQASNSSTKLEKVIEGSLADVGIVIVHINEHYASEFIGPSIMDLVDSRVASHVYEHVAWHDSLLRKHKDVPFKKGRYSTMKSKGIKYTTVNNETDPGNYDIINLNQRRLIFVGGGLGYCHQKASQKAFEQLYLLSLEKVNEIHFPLDLIYSNSVEYDSGEQYLSANIPGDVQGLMKYASVLSDQSSLISVDKKVVEMDMSFEKPTLHLAIWHQSKDMLSYLRNHEKLSLQGGKIK